LYKCEIETVGQYSIQWMELKLTYIIKKKWITIKIKIHSSLLRINLLKILEGKNIIYPIIQNRTDLARYSFIKLDLFLKDSPANRNTAKSWETSFRSIFWLREYSSKITSWY
jgi:hypothetical protein